MQMSGLVTLPNNQARCSTNDEGTLADGLTEQAPAHVLGTLPDGRKRFDSLHHMDIDSRSGTLDRSASKTSNEDQVGSRYSTDGFGSQKFDMTLGATNQDENLPLLSIQLFRSSMPGRETHNNGFLLNLPSDFSHPSQDVQPQQTSPERTPTPADAPGRGVAHSAVNSFSNRFMPTRTLSAPLTSGPSSPWHRCAPPLPQSFSQPPCPAASAATSLPTSNPPCDTNTEYTPDAGAVSGVAALTFGNIPAPPVTVRLNNAQISSMASPRPMTSAPSLPDPFEPTLQLPDPNMSTASGTSCRLPRAGTPMQGGPPKPPHALLDLLDASCAGTSRAGSCGDGNSGARTRGNSGAVVATAEDGKGPATGSKQRSAESGGCDTRLTATAETLKPPSSSAQFLPPHLEQQQQQQQHQSRGLPPSKRRHWEHERLSPEERVENGGEGDGGKRARSQPQVAPADALSPPPPPPVGPPQPQSLHNRGRGSSGGSAGGPVGPTNTAMVHPVAAAPALPIGSVRSKGVLSAKVPIIMPRQFAERVMDPATMLKFGITIIIRRLGPLPAASPTAPSRTPIVAAPGAPPAAADTTTPLMDPTGSYSAAAPVGGAGSFVTQSLSGAGVGVGVPPLQPAGSSSCGDKGVRGDGGSGGVGGGHPDLVLTAQVEQFFHAQGYSQYRVLGLKEISCGYHSWRIELWEALDARTVRLTICAPSASSKGPPGPVTSGGALAAPSGSAAAGGAGGPSAAKGKRLACDLECSENEFGDEDDLDGSPATGSGNAALPSSLEPDRGAQRPLAAAGTTLIPVAAADATCRIMYRTGSADLPMTRTRGPNARGIGGGIGSDGAGKPPSGSADGVYDWRAGVSLLAAAAVASAASTSDAEDVEDGSGALPAFDGEGGAEGASRRPRRLGGRRAPGSAALSETHAGRGPCPGGGGTGGAARTAAAEGGPTSDRPTRRGSKAAGARGGVGGSGGVSGSYSALPREEMPPELPGVMATSPHPCRKGGATVLSPEHFIHLPRLFFQEHFDTAAVLAGGLRVQVQAGVAIDPRVCAVSVASYQNHTGYRYYRLLGFKDVPRRYAGWRVAAWDKVAPDMVRVRLSPPLGVPLSDALARAMESSSGGDPSASAAERGAGRGGSTASTPVKDKTAVSSGRAESGGGGVLMRRRGAAAAAADVRMALERRCVATVGGAAGHQTWQEDAGKGGRREGKGVPPGAGGAGSPTRVWEPSGDKEVGAQEEEENQEEEEGEEERAASLVMLGLAANPQRHPILPRFPPRAGVSGLGACKAAGNAAAAGGAAGGASAGFLSKVASRADASGDEYEGADDGGVSERLDADMEAASGPEDADGSYPQLGGHMAVLQAALTRGQSTPCGQTALTATATAPSTSCGHPDPTSRLPNASTSAPAAAAGGAQVQAQVPLRRGLHPPAPLPQSPPGCGGVPNSTTSMATTIPGGGGWCDVRSLIEAGVAAALARLSLPGSRVRSVVSQHRSVVRPDKGRVYLQKPFVESSLAVATTPLGVQVLINAAGRLDPAIYRTKVTLSSSGAHGKAEYLLRLTASMKAAHTGQVIVGWSALGRQQLVMHLAPPSLASEAATSPGAASLPAAEHHHPHQQHQKQQQHAEQPALLVWPSSMRLRALGGLETRGGEAGGQPEAEDEEEGGEACGGVESAGLRLLAGASERTADMEMEMDVDGKGGKREAGGGEGRSARKGGDCGLPGRRSDDGVADVGVGGGGRGEEGAAGGVAVKHCVPWRSAAPPSLYRTLWSPGQHTHTHTAAPADRGIMVRRMMPTALTVAVGGVGCGGSAHAPHDTVSAVTPPSGRTLLFHPSPRSQHSDMAAQDGMVSRARGSWGSPHPLQHPAYRQQLPGAAAAATNAAAAGEQLDPLPDAASVPRRRRSTPSRRPRSVTWGYPGGTLHHYMQEGMFLPAGNLMGTLNTSASVAAATTSTGGGSRHVRRPSLPDSMLTAAEQLLQLAGNLTGCEIGGTSGERHNDMLGRTADGEEEEEQISGEKDGGGGRLGNSSCATGPDVDQRLEEEGGEEEVQMEDDGRVHGIRGKSKSGWEGVTSAHQRQAGYPILAGGGCGGHMALQARGPRLEAARSGPLLGATSPHSRSGGEGGTVSRFGPQRLLLDYRTPQLPAALAAVAAAASTESGSVKKENTLGAARRLPELTDIQVPTMKDEFKEETQQLRSPLRRTAAALAAMQLSSPPADAPSPSSVAALGPDSGCGFRPPTAAPPLLRNGSASAATPPGAADDSGWAPSPRGTKPAPAPAQSHPMPSPCSPLRRLQSQPQPVAPAHTSPSRGGASRPRPAEGAGGGPGIQEGSAGQSGRSSSQALSDHPQAFPRGATRVVRGPSGVCAPCSRGATGPGGVQPGKGIMKGGAAEGGGVSLPPPVGTGQPGQHMSSVQVPTPASMSAVGLGGMAGTGFDLSLLQALLPHMSALSAATSQQQQNSLAQLWQWQQQQQRVGGIPAEQQKARIESLLATEVQQNRTAQPQRTTQMERGAIVTASSVTAAIPIGGSLRTAARQAPETVLSPQNRGREDPPPALMVASQAPVAPLPLQGAKKLVTRSLQEPAAPVPDETLQQASCGAPRPQAHVQTGTALAIPSATHPAAAVGGAVGAPATATTADLDLAAQLITLLGSGATAALANGPLRLLAAQLLQQQHHQQRQQPKPQVQSGRRQREEEDTAVQGQRQVQSPQSSSPAGGARGDTTGCEQGGVGAAVMSSLLGKRGRIAERPQSSKGYSDDGRQDKRGAMEGGGRGDARLQGSEAARGAAPGKPLGRHAQQRQLQQHVQYPQDGLQPTQGPQLHTTVVQQLREHQRQQQQQLQHQLLLHHLQAQGWQAWQPVCTAAPEEGNQAARDALAAVVDTVPVRGRNGREGPTGEGAAAGRSGQGEGLPGRGSAAVGNSQGGWNCGGLSMRDLLWHSGWRQQVVERTAASGGPLEAERAAAGGGAAVMAAGRTANHMGGSA